MYRSTNSQVGRDLRGGYHIKTLIVNFATISRNLGGSVTNHESLNCADSRSNSEITSPEENRLIQGRIEKLRNYLP